MQNPRCLEANMFQKGKERREVLTWSQHREKRRCHGLVRAKDKERPVMGGSLLRE